VSITAVVLSRDPIGREGLGIPAGVEFLNHCETFTTTAGIHAARRRAVARVQTESFFFLDSDDDLPPDAAETIEQCVAAGVGLAFTDEVEHRDGAENVHTLRAPYELRQHALRPLLVHHLAVVRTDVAQEALQVIPEGELWVEQALYFEVSRVAGAAHIPRIGYNWRPGSGMHRARGLVAAMCRSSAWCYRRL
jgi:hypothetical protein